MEQQLSYVAIPSESHNYDYLSYNSISDLILCVKWSSLKCKGKSAKMGSPFPEKKCARETILNINHNNH